LSRSIQIVKQNDAAATAFFSGLSAGRFSGDSSFKLGRIEKAQPRHPIRRSGDAEILSSNPIMQDRVRESYLNVPLVKRAADLIRDFVVGTGVQTFLDPIDWSFGFDLKRRPDEDLLHSLNVALEMDEKFADWAQNPKWCDVQGKRSWVELQRLAINDEVLTGDSVVMYGPAPSDSPIPWAVLLIEKEQIDSSKDRDFGKLTEFGNIETAVIHGFVIDRNGREIGCYITMCILTGFWRPLEIQSLSPPPIIITCFRLTAPVNMSGRPGFTPWGNRRSTWIDGGEAELRKAIKQSLVAMVHKSKTPDHAIVWDR
jgi:hypothetical protein